MYKHFSFLSAFSWDPNDIRLAVCAGNNKLYMWSMAGCLAVEVPGEGSFIFSVVLVYKFFGLNWFFLCYCLYNIIVWTVLITVHSFFWKSNNFLFGKRY